MGFLTVIFIIIISIYLLGFLGRVALRFWLLKKQKEYEQNGSTGGFGSFRQYTYGGNSAKNQKRPEGEIKVQNLRNQEKKVSKSVGDYVDYEEIKEK